MKRIFKFDNLKPHIHRPPIQPLPSTLKDVRLPICQECEEFGAAKHEKLDYGCEKQFPLLPSKPNGTCIKTWSAWLTNKDSKCPLGKW